MNAGLATPETQAAADLRPADIEYFHRGERENQEFWRRMGLQPELAGARVLDLGCGLGTMCVGLAQAGAKDVVGLDTDSRLIAFASAYVARKYSDCADRIRFLDVDLRDYAGPSFDFVVTKDTFEHILDLPGVLRELRTRLRPGGRIYAGFGPLYYSPFGHHGRLRTWLPWPQFPWGHLLEREERIIARLNRRRAAGENIFCYHDGPIASIQDLGLNQYSLLAYERAFVEAGFKIARFRVNQSRQLLSKVCTILRRIPFLREYCTHNVYCVLER